MDFIILDIAMLQLAFALAYWTRHGIQKLYTNALYSNLAIIFLLCDFLVLLLGGSMKNVLKRGDFKEAEQTVRHTFLLMLMISFYMFLMQMGEEYSRIVFILTWIYYAMLAFSSRVIWKRYLLRRKQENPDFSVYFLTTKDRTEKVLNQYLKNNKLHNVVQGICILDSNCIGQKISGVPVTASSETVLSYLCDKWVDEVFVSLSDTYPFPDELISSLVEMGIVVHVEIEKLEIDQWQHQIIETVAGVTVRTISMTMLTSRQMFLKRTFDIIGGLVGCFLTVIFTLIIGPMIYIQSPGPIFFTQTRVGKNGRKFKLYKFRSMCLDAEERKAELLEENRMESGLMFKLEYDPRIIGCKRRSDGTIKKGIGNFIRDYSIDEFPQFFNVLKGDLSLCGTRPPTVDEWEQYELQHRVRLAAKPGITGLWQISGRSNITNFEQVVALDKKYIQEWSMGLDLRILFQTVKVVLHKDGSM